jgi:predicted RNA methylase
LANKINFNNYTIEQYIADVKKHGLDTLWAAILKHSLIHHDNGLLSPGKFGELYEMGLALQNKADKKKSGQYFTPDDVSRLMSRWLKTLKGDAVCDVGCGTGNLILSFLEQAGKAEAKRLLSQKKIYLYDNDKTALNIAQYSIAIIYGKEYLNSVNLICGDFLDKKIKLPVNAKVISNPPYAKINDFKPCWEKTENLLSGRDYYSAFIEKIARSGARAVIISPFSFLGGSKFYNLRSVLNDYNGFIAAFDNVPGNIFCGRKHGVFNSNTANSVRAAITVIENDGKEKGFRISHLIRFKTEEREKLLDNKRLMGMIGKKRQTVSREEPAYVKCHKELEKAYYLWISKSDKKLGDLLSFKANKYALYIPNTCRYFTTASVLKLKRTGVITLYAKDDDSFNFLYCLVNSSFAYWYWRIFDGGITYPVSLLKSVPVFEGLLTKKDSSFFAETRKKMSALEKKFIVTKLNAGAVQQNIKFPPEYREKINTRFFKILGCGDKPEILDMLHNNTVFD